jgi:hypothetical protein
LLGGGGLSEVEFRELPPIHRAEMYQTFQTATATTGIILAENVPSSHHITFPNSLPIHTFQGCFESSLLTRLLFITDFILKIFFLSLCLVAADVFIY